MMFCKESEFQDSPISKIPEDWKIQELSDFVEIETGKRAKGGGLSEGTVASIGGEHIDGQGNILWSDMKYIPDDFYNLLKQGRVQIGDILLVKDGATTGKVAIVKYLKYEKVAVNEHVFLIRSKTERLSNEFLYYFLFSVFGQRQIRTRFHGLIGGIIRNDLENVLVPIPSIVEQRGVVGVLGVVDSAIGLVDKVIAKTERLKKGLMQTLLTRGIEHKEYKETPIGKITKEWDVKRLEEASKEVTIGVVNPATPYYTSANDGVPYFRSQNVRENRLEPTNVYVRPEFNERHPRSVLKENDILTLQTGFIGVSCIVPKEYEGANCHSLLITRTNPKMLNPQFLCQFLNSAVGKKIINRHNSGWGRAHLLLEDFRRISIPLPPLQEQQTIAEILSTIDKRIKLERKEKTRLERIKRGLMDLLLTGKVRVRVD
jgi:type I restriction enzyme S subunit